MVKSRKSTYLVVFIFIMGKRVYCIGELLIDFVAENQGSDLTRAVNFTKKAGGAPANVACAISKLGGLSSFIGCVGEDAFGSFLLQMLEDHGVETHMAQRSSTFTTLAFVSLAEDGERDFVFSRGADRELAYNAKVGEKFQDEIVHFGAATALLGGPLETSYTKYLADATTYGAFISFDPNFRGDLWKGNEGEFVAKCKPYFKRAQLCKVSMEEAQLLSGATGLEDAAKALHQLGTHLVTITLGGEGTFISTPNFQTTIPSIKVTPVDTTGAGDAFIGCLLQQLATLEKPSAALEKKETLMEMIAMANKAGALTTTNFGAIESLPDRNKMMRS